jgi:hypothetical protein
MRSTKVPRNDWVSQALDHAQMKQAELSRALIQSGLSTIDRSAVNKIVLGTRKLSAEEMLVISKITRFQIQGGAPPTQAVEEAGQTGQIPKDRLRKLTDKIDALESELDSALDVLWRHGDREAHDWMWLNYPERARRLALRVRLGPRLVKAAREANAIAKGEANPSTYRMHFMPGDAEGDDNGP